MTRRRDPFTNALDSLRSRAEQGVYVPGSQVVIMDEARRLSLSATPVREALVWLCGYGLIERSPMGGFLVPRLDPATVRDRLEFRLQCVINNLTASRTGMARDQAMAGSGVQAGRDLPGLMLRAVKGTGNAALIDAYQRVCSQLIQLSPAEARLFPDLDSEEADVVRLFETADDGLAETLTRYHHRRMEAAPLLILEAEAVRGAIRDAG